MAKDIGRAFEQHIKTTINNDMRGLSVRIAQFVDGKVISRKFNEGFEGHTLSPRYVAAKKRAGYPATVGTRTGALRRAATQVTNWSLWQPTLGKLGALAIKQKRGLTAYANEVRTREGVLDYLTADADDTVNIQSAIFRFLGSNYRQTGTIKVH